MASGMGEFKAQMISSGLLHSSLSSAFTAAFRLKFKEWQNGWQQSQNPESFCFNTSRQAWEFLLRKFQRILVAFIRSCSRLWGGHYGQKNWMFGLAATREIVLPQMLGAVLAAVHGMTVGGRRLSSEKLDCAYQDGERMLNKNHCSCPPQACWGKNEPIEGNWIQKVPFKYK